MKHEASLDPARVPLVSLSRADWSTLFDGGLRATPRDIEKGAEIVLWYSAEVHSTLTLTEVRPGATSPMPPSPLLPQETFVAKPGGVVFLHGIFFAHDGETTGAQVGTTDPMYQPRDATTIGTSQSGFDHAVLRSATGRPLGLYRPGVAVRQRAATDIQPAAWPRYLLLATARDGTLATTAQFTSVRVVCNNTLAIALGNGTDAIKVGHRSQFDAQAVKRQLGIAISSWDGFMARMKALSDYKSRMLLPRRSSSAC